MMDGAAEREIIVPDDIINSIAENETEFCRKVKKIDPLTAARNLTTGYKHSLNILQHLGNLKGLNKLDGQKILEIGSGNGFFLCYALKHGLDIVGIEPGKTFGFTKRYEIATKLLEVNGIKNPNNYLYDSSAEDLPFSDNSFDIVFSLAVFEHVQDIDLSIKEAIRVLRPGGIMFASVPNYNSRWEEHYDIYWIPYMNKKIAKLYVRLLGRDPGFIDDLIFTKPSLFSKYLNSKDVYGNISLYGKDGGIYNMLPAFYRMFADGSTPDPKALHGLKKIIAYLLRVKLISSFCKYLSGILIKASEYFGSARIINVILVKR